MYEVNPAFFDCMELDEAMYLLDRYNYMRRKENESMQKQIDEMRSKHGE